MRGILLYSVTLLLETVSVVCRLLLVSFLVGVIFGQTPGIVMGTLAAAGPVLLSLLVVSGLPSGHLILRAELRGRRPTIQEQARIDAALNRIVGPGVPLPRRIFVLDRPGINAAVSGTTLYVYRQTIASRYLSAVLAHELGHLSARDGHLLLALRSLTVPGGFLIANMLILGIRLGMHLIFWALRLVLVPIYLLLGRAGVHLITWLSYMLLGAFPRLIVIFAMGGLSVQLLEAGWQRYFIDAEYAADAYAASLGEASGLIELFTHLSFVDVELPWSSRVTHPPIPLRIKRLREVAPMWPQRPIDGRLSLAQMIALDLQRTAPSRQQQATQRRYRPWIRYGGLSAGLVLALTIVFFIVMYMQPAEPRFRPQIATPVQEALPVPTVPPVQGSP